MKRFNIYCLSVALALVVCSFPAGSEAKPLNCNPVTSLPAVISTEGVFCLTGNLATTISSGKAIEIDADNVTLDLEDWKLDGQAGGTATIAYGIYSAAANVTIKDGSVRGFNGGIYLTGRGDVVRDMRLDQNTGIGIYVNGQGAVVEHNQVVDTDSTELTAFGILADPGSVGARISDNTVSGVTVTTTGVSERGIEALGANGTVRDNAVSNNAKLFDTTGSQSVGINLGKNIAVDNTVSNFDIGIYSDGGIYAHNTVYNCTTAYVGGTAGAGNSP